MSTWAFVQKNKATQASSASCAVSLTGVTPGDLLVLGFSAFQTNSGTTWGVSDGSNTWIPGPTQDNVNFWVGSLYAIATTGGNLTFTLLGSNSGSFLAVGINEYSLPSGTTLGTPITAKAIGISGTPNSGNVSFGGSNSYLAWGAAENGNATTMAATGSWTSRNTAPFVNSVNEAYCDGDQLNLLAASSPVAFTASVTGSNWAAACILFPAVPSTGIITSINFNGGFNNDFAGGLDS